MMKNDKKNSRWNNFIMIGLLLFGMKIMLEQVVLPVLGYDVGGSHILEAAAGVGCGLMLAGAFMVYIGVERVKEWKRRLFHR